MDQTDRVVTNFNQITRVESGQATNRNSNKNGQLNKSDVSKENILANQSTNSTNTTGEASAASKRPKNTALKQQRLPAWQPILTAKTVLPLFFSIGVVFVVLGGVLLHYSNIVS